MANQDKTVVHGKVDKEGNKKFKIKKDKSDEEDIDIEILADGEYQVDKLDTNRLPTTMPNGISIRWINNFSIKENGQYIQKRYRVRIPGISKWPSERNLVILNGSGELYYYEGVRDGDIIELDDGDPGVGSSPP